MSAPRAVLGLGRSLTRSLRPLSSSSTLFFRRSFALDSSSTASSSGPTKTGQSPSGSANNQQVGSSTGINASHNAQKPTTAHSMGASAGANTGDRPATSTPMSGAGTGHDQSQSMDSYARQADKASKDRGKASHETEVSGSKPGSANATSGDESMTGGKVTSKGKDAQASASMGKSSDAPAGPSDSTVGQGGAIGTQGSNSAGGGSLRGNSGTATSSAGTGLSGGGIASMTDQAKEKIHQLTGDVELPAASSYTVVALVMLAVPVIFALDPDYRFLAKEAAEQEKAIQHKYHSID